MFAEAHRIARPAKRVGVRRHSEPQPSQFVRIRGVIAAALPRCIPSLPLLVGLAAFCRALASQQALLNDPDTYLHIAAGRWILAHAGLPSADPFSHTMAGAYWAAPEWLAETILAALYRTGGWAAVIVATVASFAAALAILTRHLLRRLPVLPCLILAFAAMALLLPHLVARPHVLALPILAMWSASLLAARDAGKSPPWPVLALMPLWANLHGSCLFGLALAGFVAAEAVLSPGAGQRRIDEFRRWAWFVAAAAVAASLTPNGPAGLIAPLRLMAMPALQTSFGEWLPPDLARSPELELWLLGALALGLAGGVRLPLPRLALLLALFHATLQHARHADLLALVGPLILAGGLRPAWAERMRAGEAATILRRLGRLAEPARAPALAAALTVAVAVALPTLAKPNDRGDDPVTPAVALAAAQRLGLPGAVFNAEPFGGYLLFAGVPSFIDGRIEMYGDRFLARSVAAERGDPASLRSVLEHYRIGWTLVQPGSGAAAALDRMPGWQRVYADEFAVVHARLAPP